MRRGAADLSFLQTALNAAVEREDYEEAAALRDRVTAATSVQVGGGADWRAESVPEWLADRLARLNFRAPTLVQTNALRAILSGDDAAVVAATGSGKTLGYLVPLLSRLSEDLLEEDLSGYLADFLRAAARGGAALAAAGRPRRVRPLAADAGGADRRADARARRAGLAPRLPPARRRRLQPDAAAVRRAIPSARNSSARHSSARNF